jgi:hypothetical protein
MRREVPTGAGPQSIARADGRATARMASRRARALVTVLLLALTASATLATTSGDVAPRAAETTRGDGAVEAASERVVAFASSDSRPRRASSARTLLSKPNTRAKPDYDVYLTRARALEEIERVARENPAVARLEWKRRSTRDGNYTAAVPIVTVDLAAREREEGEEGEDGGGERPRVLLNYGEHGRELITVDVAVALVRALAEGGADAAARLAHAEAGDAALVAAALRRAIFKIVPMENVNGRDAVERGEYCERKNGRGVDTNRNFGVDWGVVRSISHWFPYDRVGVVNADP